MSKLQQKEYDVMWSEVMGSHIEKAKLIEAISAAEDILHEGDIGIDK
jgi:hypothetical protein